MKFALFLILLVSASMGCSSDSDPAPEERPGTSIERSCDTILQARVDTGNFFVAGEFNAFEAVEARSEGESISLSLGPLDPGTYAWDLLEDGEIVPPPVDVETKWYEGVERRKLKVPDCRVPTWRSTQPASFEEGVLRARYQFARAADGASLDVDSVLVEIAGALAPEESYTVDANAETLEIHHEASEPGKYSIRIFAQDEDGNAPDNDGLWTPVWYEEEDFEWQDGVIYLAFTDRFRDSDGVKPEKPTPELSEIASFMGGDFEGVRGAVEEDYFESMGANILWLSPIYENPEAAFDGRDPNLYTGYHGYWPTNSLSAEASYGGDEALAGVVEAAHERGMRIMFDVVLNHVHEDHNYCTENPSWCEKTCVCGTENCAWEGPEGKPVICQFAPYLPDLNYKNDALLERVIEDVFDLMIKFDVDGLRIDAAKHMNHVIMRTLRSRLEEVEARGGAEFYLVGETFTGDRGLIMNYVGDHELHGQFDFPLFYAIRGTFAGNGSFRDLEAAASESARVYGSAYPWMSPFLGNHDIPRFATEAAGNDQGPFGNTPDLIANGPTTEIDQPDLINRISMAFAFVLTQPGVPLIYYGDEVGLAGGPDPDNRRMMPRALNANQLEILRRVQSLGQMRAELPAMRGEARQEIWLDDSLYVYLRTNEEDVAFVALNKGDSERSESVSIPSALGLSGRTLEVYGDEERTFNVIEGAVQLTIQPWEYLILVPRDE